MAEETLPNKNERMVIAYYADEAAAEQALDAVRKWDAADKNVKLGHSGILVKKDGKVKTHDSGRNAGKGIAVGAGIGLLGVLTGGIGLLGGLVAGGALGGVVGSLFKKGIGITPDDMQEISEKLDAGGAAVVVMCDDYEVDGVVADLKQHGGTVTSYDVSSALIPDVEEAVAKATGEAADATGEAADATADAAKSAGDAVADAGDKVAAATADAAKSAGDAVAGASDKVADAAEDAGNAVADAAKAAGDAAKSAGDDAAKAIKS